MTKEKLRIGVVIPWFGRDLVGGAEQYCYHLTRSLAALGHRIEVLTTCCRSFQSGWDTNELDAGLSFDGSIGIRRFPVDRRNSRRFNAANETLMAFNNVPKIPYGNFFPEEAGESFFVDNIHSYELMDFLAREQAEFDAFLFIPYLYGPILMGLPIVAHKAYLIPCLHDETYAYLPEVARIFSLARGLFFISEGEYASAKSLFGPYVASKAEIIGGGVEVNADDRAMRPRSLPEHTVNFLLYLGRKDETKNTSELLDEFSRFLKNHPDAQLILAGPGDLKGLRYQGQSERILDLGLVSPEEKIWLIKNCRALAQPSKNESYSRTMIEAWTFGKPVLVHAGCAATSQATEKAQAGWICGSSGDWQEALLGIFSEDAADQRHLLGRNGEAYAAEHGNWSSVARRALAAISLQKPKSPEKGRSKGKIHQILPGFSTGDAISNQAQIIRRIILSLGYESLIYAVHVIGQAASRLSFVKHIDDFIGVDDCSIVYHHSTHFSELDRVLDNNLRKLMIYHNVTPPEFFREWSFVRTREMCDGLRQIDECRDRFDRVVADSYFNARELQAKGYRNVQPVYLGVDPIRWSSNPCRKTLSRYRDGYLNFLFVGRVAPNKCQHDLIKLFAAIHRRKPLSRLLLVGGYDEYDPYYWQLTDLAASLGVQEKVVFASHVTEAELHSFYLAADAFVCMSEHEGFCVPLIEAQQFEIPCYAFAATAVLETAVQGSMLFDHKNHEELAPRILEDLERPRKPSNGEALRKFSLETMVESWIAVLEEWMAIPRRVEEAVQQSNEADHQPAFELPPGYMQKRTAESIKKMHLPELF